ncbi:MAG: homocysteine S-methyltransferase family protein [Prevotella sp.]|jgi:5-methyltetrahydrofolate--homocysteine methyltransferase
MKCIQDTAKQKIIILDGAMGTRLQRYDLTENDFRGQCFAHLKGQLKGNYDVLCLTRPDIVADVHRKYLEAGADMIETNTFSSQRISQADYGLEAEAGEMALEGARIARRVADEFTTENWPRYVAGSMGPTNRMLSMSCNVNNRSSRTISYEELFLAYEEQALALLKGGVDVLLIETCIDLLNAQCAVNAARHAMKRVGREVPLMVSFTINDASGRTFCGQSLDDIMTGMEPLNLWCMGLNCGLGAKQLKPFVEQLSSKSPFLVSVYLSAGLPNAMGKYDETPEKMAEEMKEYIDDGLVNILGGCCGTDEEYIRRFAQMAFNRSPRKPVERNHQVHLSSRGMLRKREVAG